MFGFSNSVGRSLPRLFHRCSHAVPPSTPACLRGRVSVALLLSSLVDVRSGRRQRLWLRPVVICRFVWRASVASRDAKGKLDKAERTPRTLLVMALLPMRAVGVMRTEGVGSVIRCESPHPQLSVGTSSVTVTLLSQHWAGTELRCCFC